MTETAEVRSNVNSKTNSVISSNNFIPFDVVDFNVGGLYNISTYKYTFLVAGTYTIGESHSKNEANGEVQIRLERDEIMRVISRVNNTNGFLNNTINSCLVYKFIVRDVLYCYTAISTGNIQINNTTYTTNDIYNSFWGIRLDY
jgi:hypothetical protein